MNNVVDIKIRLLFLLASFKAPEVLAPDFKQARNSTLDFVVF